MLRSSPLRRGPWPSRCVKSVALSSAQSCTAAHRRLASLHLRESRLAQLAAASRDLAVPLRAERSDKSSSELHSGPQPPRDTPPRSVASCAARRCVAALGRPAPCTVSRLVQLNAARRPTAASRHSTSERGALRSSPLRRGTWPSRCVHSVAPGSAQSCTAAHSRLASFHLGESRLAQLTAASRPLASRSVQRVAPSLARSCTVAHSRLTSPHLGASRLAQLVAASRDLAVPLRA